MVKEHLLQPLIFVDILFATEIQNLAKVLLVSKAIFKPRSLDRSSNASIKSDDRWWVFDIVKDDNVQWCCVFGKVFIKPLRKIMKMTNDGLFHDVLTELVIFEKVAQLSKHIQSSTFNSASPMLNFLFEGFMLISTVRMLK